MSVSAEEIDRARALVARALSISIDQVGPDAGLRRLADWDSLGQLSVILEIEAVLRTQITDAPTFDSLVSVPGIAAYLAKHRP